MKIKYYPYQPHCFAFGGFDMQMLNALEAVKKNGVDAGRLDIWSRDRNFDILHLWGISEHNYHIIYWAKKANIKLIATILLPYSTLRLWLGYYKNLYTSHMRLAKYYYSLIDKVVVVNEIQAKMLHDYYKVNLNKIEIIPNIVKDSFFSTPKIDFKKEYNFNNYILCTGNICERKNQLNLAKACNNIGLNLVLIGDCLEGQNEYCKSLQKLVDVSNNIKWIKGLEEGSDILVSAYHHSIGFALVSYEETQPISVLEAVAMKKPIILQNKGYAYQKYYSNAVLCKDGSISSIQRALKDFIAENHHVKANEFITDCMENKVGLKYVKVYNDLFK